MIRGAEREYETSLGDYKEVNGWYIPFSVESNVKGNSNRAEVTYQKIEANVPMDDARFRMPAAVGSASRAASRQMLLKNSRRKRTKRSRQQSQAS